MATAKWRLRFDPAEKRDWHGRWTGGNIIADRTYGDGQREIWVTSSPLFTGTVPANPDRSRTPWVFFPAAEHSKRPPTLVVGSPGSYHAAVMDAAKRAGVIRQGDVLTDIAEGVMFDGQPYGGLGSKPGVYFDVGATLPGAKKATRRAFHGEKLFDSSAQLLRFDPRQPRDSHGRWVKGAAGAIKAASGALEDGEASDYLDRRFADWGQHISALDLIGLQGYRKRGGADALNNYLRFYPDAYDEDPRFQGFPKEELNWWKGGLDRAIAASPPVGKELDLHMFRGLTHLSTVIGDAKVGDEFTDKGFVSTTTDIQVAKDYAGAEGGPGTGHVVAITIPKEAHGAWMRANPSLNDSTHELVLPRNSRFKIVKKNPSPGVDLELELVLGKPTKPKVQRAIERARKGRPVRRQASWRFNPQEARDWHGRWTAGASSLAKSVGEIKLSKPDASITDVVSEVDQLPPKVAEQFRAALRQIDEVHRPLQGSSVFPVRLADQPKRKGEKDLPPPEATTWFGQPGKTDDDPLSPDLPVFTEKMTLSPHPTGDFKATVIHEMGHAMDNELGDGAIFTLPTPGHPTITRDPEGQELIRALGNSKAIKTLMRWRSMEMSGMGFMVGIPEAGVQYLLDPREVFARAYAQWIISQTGTPEERREMQIETESGSSHVPAQWEPDDFRPIAAAMTKLFRSRGLLRSQTTTKRSRGYLR